MCLDYFLCLALVYLVASSRGHGDEAFAGLKQIPTLNLTQVTLIAENATARCNLIPNLCNWQLHLYGGHAFSVPLKQEEQKKAMEKEIIKPKPTRTVFTLSLPDDSKELLFYADIEPKSRAMEKRRKRRLRPRRPATFHSVGQRNVILWLFK
ncbi:uncharacterized protein Dwil_GK22886 [Drosophila willistoni]|uniref:Uncharacterized protein n=1 Tax=Drosophila willistoni TaxID=7260 RepID=B4NNI0_DROWI|nr:uncharacterized protein LOC124459842 [Drosophila willistoni]EDW85919.1 uncharacterized protein Dwil_GK22886 [Drosophila willistoni]